MNRKKYRRASRLLPPLLFIAILLGACSPQAAVPTKVAAPQVENTPIATEPAAIEIATLDETDSQLFQRTAQAFELFQEKSDQIWQESYRLDQMALMLVRNDGEQDQYAYLLNHPKAAEIAGAEQVDLPAALNLPPVYRFSSIPDSAKIAKVANFDFNFNLEDIKTYVMKYTTADVDEFAAPVSHEWTLYLAHEGLHDSQMDLWQEAPGNYQDIAGYPLNADHLALIMLEDAVLKASVQANDPAVRTETLKQFVAIRQTRINRWDEVRLLDLPQEQIEGTARYLEHRLGDLLGYNQTNLSNFDEMMGIVPSSDIRDAVAFGRFYETGAAQSHLLNQLGIDWKTQIEQGKSQFDVLAAHFNLSDAEIDALLDIAKSDHNFDALQPAAQKAAETAATEPSDVFAEDYSDMGDDETGEYIEFAPFPEKPFETAPTDLVFTTSPAGYDLQGGYSVTANEIQSDIRPFYSPAESDLQVVVWGGAGFLQVTRAQHNFDSLDDLLESIPEIATSERKTLAGQEILFDDFTDQYGPYTVATFLRDDDFITIEGTVEAEVMLEMVTDLLSK